MASPEITLVVPAKAGTQGQRSALQPWIPAPELLSKGAGNTEIRLHQEDISLKRIEERCRKVALGEAREHDDDHLARHLEPRAHLERRGDGGAGGDADRQALHLRRLARGAESGLV